MQASAQAESTFSERDPSVWTSFQIRFRTLGSTEGTATPNVYITERSSQIILTPYGRQSSVHLVVLKTQHIF